jgi:hypothetical protein
VLARLTALLVDALLAPDPPAALAAALAREGAALDPAERAALAQVEPDGLRLCARLVEKLRLERLLAGDARLRADFRTDPAGFSARFRRYAAEVPPATPWPAEEVAAFRAWSHR